METVEIEISADKGNYTATLLPEGFVHNCRHCKAEIRFARNIRGNTFPVSETEDGWRMHLSVCEGREDDPRNRNRY